MLATRLITRLSIKWYQFTDHDNAPAKLKWGGHFGVPTGMWSFPAHSRAQGTQLWKATGQN